MTSPIGAIGALTANPALSALATPAISPATSPAVSPAAGQAGGTAIGSIGGIGNLPDSGALGVTGTSAASPTSFAAALDKASQAEQVANSDALGLATGKLTNIEDFTAAAAQARLEVQTATAIRNRAVSAFNDIMHMQV